MVGILKKNLSYPSQTRRMGIEGIVIVRFVVNTDGSIQDLELLRKSVAELTKKR
jgi:protein TonB